MKNQKQETQLKLSKNQIQNIINTHIQEEHGLNDLFAMMVNGLMLSERKAFLDEDVTEGNKGNGYRKATKLELSHIVCLTILFLTIEGSFNERAFDGWFFF